MLSSESEFFPPSVPRFLLQDLGDDAGAHRAAALADREAQLLLHRDRRDQLDRHLRVVTPDHHVLAPPFLSLPHPHIPPPAPPLTSPAAPRPLATAPRPVIENTSSAGLRNGLPTSRLGTGMLFSTAVSSSSTFATPGFSPAIAFRA